MKNTSITKLMSKEFKLIGINEPLNKAEEILFSNKFKHLPVMKKQKLVGIISKTDIKRMSFADELGDSEFEADAEIFKMLTVGQVMINKPFTLTVKATIKDAAKVLSEKEFRSIPILDGDKVVGIVTTKDLVKYLSTEEDISLFSEIEPMGIIDEKLTKCALFNGKFGKRDISIRWYFEYEVPRFRMDWGHVNSGVQNCEMVYKI